MCTCCNFGTKDVSYCYVCRFGVVSRGVQVLGIGPKSVNACAAGRDREATRAERASTALSTLSWTVSTTTHQRRRGQMD